MVFGLVQRTTVIVIGSTTAIVIGGTTAIVIGRQGTTAAIIIGLLVLGLLPLCVLRLNEGLRLQTSIVHGFFERRLGHAPPELALHVRVVLLRGVAGAVA